MMDVPTVTTKSWSRHGPPKRRWRNSNAAPAAKGASAGPEGRRGVPPMMSLPDAKEIEDERLSGGGPADHVHGRRRRVRELPEHPRATVPKPVGVEIGQGVDDRNSRAIDLPREDQTGRHGIRGASTHPDDLIHARGKDLAEREVPVHPSRGRLLNGGRGAHGEDVAGDGLLGTVREP